MIIKTLEYENHRINNSIVHLQRNDDFNESDNYRWVKITENIELDALFGLIYFRG